MFVVNAVCHCAACLCDVDLTMFLRQVHAEVSLPAVAQRRTGPIVDVKNKLLPRLLGASWGESWLFTASQHGWLHKLGKLMNWPSTSLKTMGVLR